MVDVLLAHQALAEPARLAIAQALLTRDLSPGEIGATWCLSTSLVAHHVGVLVDAGLIVRRRGEHDARRSYLSLHRQDPQVLALVDVGMEPTPAPRRVAFVCTRNSARSKLAAAYWKRVSRIPAVDAGTAPADSPHPLTLETAARRGLDLDDQMHDAATTLNADDLVIVVCDHAHERLGFRAERLHWSVSDPVARPVTSSFDAACDDIQARIGQLEHTLRAIGSAA